ncbi:MULTISPECIES: conjugal transfer protein TraN [unclassified Sphingomonas]|uniref:conjugal transfer protein TraN n=1 Tax=Novosphingobium rhizosphaerae TaxID=1551649 RepID=UPI0015C705B2
MTSGEARGDAEAMARSVRDRTSTSILKAGNEANVPGFGGTDIPAQRYSDDPIGLTAAGEAQRYQEQYRTVVAPHRKVFDPATIDLSSASAIEGNPDKYLGAGSGVGGETKTCTPLPGGGTGTTSYLESCNTGSQPFDQPRTCNASLRVQTEGRRYWEYGCETDEFAGRDQMCAALVQAPGSSACTFDRSVRIGQRCLQWVAEDNGRKWCAEPGEPIFRQFWQCPAPLSGVPGGIERSSARIVSETIDDGACQSATSDATCTLASEVCTAPGETRVINGLSVTRSCWEWQRTYQCQGVAPANDCGALEARADCTFSHDECLSFDPDGVTCNVHDRWYQCAIPGAGTPAPSAYVCAGDLYCIDGECTQVTREASTEFKDAMVAMNVLGELRDGFDPDRLKIFSGEHLRCTRKIFGLSNCCSGKGVPLLTPFVCGREDREVDKRDDAGLCHYVGTYCSARVLGVCVTRKQSYCCYGSKLVRILNEQGKAQLGMQWGTPKEPDCEGFLVAQFQQLDLSRMDFREVYAEFTDAAKLPSEIDLSIQIQQKIESYYTAHGGT